MLAAVKCICQLEQHLPGKLTSLRGAFSQVPVPQHRMTPLKNAWLQLYEPITKNLKLDMRMNLKTKKVCSYFAKAAADVGVHRAVRRSTRCGLTQTVWPLLMLRRWKSRRRPSALTQTCFKRLLTLCMPTSSVRCSTFGGGGLAAGMVGLASAELRCIHMTMFPSPR